MTINIYDDEFDVKDILKEAIDKGASDIFFVAGSPYAFKINGSIIKEGTERLTPDLCESIIKKIYAESNCADYEQFAKKGDDDFSISIGGIGRFRVNAYRQRNSQAAVLRVVRFELPDYQELHIPESIMNFADEKKGIILVTGPADSGKSTTLACVIDRINTQRNCHIVTIEDPIEFIHSHKSGIISQREVLHDTEGYLTALRAALRESPEVILLGEMRDPETISTALTAAETGHLLFSTLHTVGCVNTIDRIIDSFEYNQSQIRSQLSMVLNAVVCEQLVPGIDGKVIPVFEIMKLNTAIRSQIREGKLHLIENTMTSCKNEGMITMDEALLNLVRQKKITAETAMLYSVHPEIMGKRLQV